MARKYNQKARRETAVQVMVKQLAKYSTDLTDAKTPEQVERIKDKMSKLKVCFANTEAKLKVA